MAFELPALPYDYEALAALTCRRRRSNSTTTSTTRPMSTTATSSRPKPAWTSLSLEEVVKQSFGKNAGLFNNAGQHYNHIHFWKWMKKGGGGNKLPGALQKAVDSDLGGYDKFKADFIAAGTTQFGSGWAWVSVKDGKLAISKTPNGENPLVHGATPILGVDVWEHSYYIDYRNARPKYLEAFVDSLINWDYVLELYEAAKADLASTAVENPGFGRGFLLASCLPATPEYHETVKRASEYFGHGFVVSVSPGNALPATGGLHEKAYTCHLSSRVRRIGRLCRSDRRPQGPDEGATARRWANSCRSPRARSRSTPPRC